MKGYLVMSDSSVLKEQRAHCDRRHAEDPRIMNYIPTTLWQNKKEIL